MTTRHTNPHRPTTLDDPSVALHRRDRADQAFRAELGHLADAIDANWQPTIAGLEPERLHDLRVGVRRTRSVLGLSKGVLPEDLRTRFRAEFAWLAGATGPTRDLDAYLAEWPRAMRGLSVERGLAAGPVLRHIERHRQIVRTELVGVLESARASEIRSAWRDALASSPTEVPRHASRPIGRVIAQRFRRTHRAVVRGGRAIEHDSPAEALHDLRKDAKQLRYLIECFGTLVPHRAFESYVGQLKGLQDNLGAHQDAQVHGAELERIAVDLTAEGAPAETLIVLGQLIERLERTSIDMRAEFAERFHAFDSSLTEDVVARIIHSLRG